MICLFLFMHTNHSNHRVAGRGCRHCVSLLSLGSWMKRSSSSVSCNSLNIQGEKGGGGSRVEPQRFSDGRPPDVESITEQSRADKSKSSRTLTGWIETPQILSALLNFTKMKVGGEKIQQRPTSCSLGWELRDLDLFLFFRHRWRNSTIAPSEPTASSSTVQRGPVLRVMSKYSLAHF